MSFKPRNSFLLNTTSFFFFISFLFEVLRIIHSILVQRSRWCIQDQPLVTQDLKPVSSWVQLFRRLSGTFNHLHLITLSSAQLLGRGAYRDSPLEWDCWKESGEEEAWRHKMEALICGIAFKSSSPSSAGAKRNTLSKPGRLYFSRAARTLPALCGAQCALYVFICEAAADAPPEPSISPEQHTCGGWKYLHYLLN